MKKVLRFICNHFEEVLCCIALVVTISAVLINILSGILFEKRYGQCEEIAKSAFVWITYVGVSVAYKHNAHICVDFLVKSLPALGQRITKYVCWAVMLMFSAVVLYFAVQLTINTYRKTLPLCGVSYAYINISLVIGFGMIIVRLLADIIKEILSGVKR